MQVDVYRSLDLHGREDAAYWASLPADVRVLQVWKLSEEQWRLRREWPHERGFSRSVARLLRGRLKDLGDLEALGERGGAPER